MKNLWTLLMIVLLATACRTRKKSLDITEYRTAEIEKIKVDSSSGLHEKSVTKIKDDALAEKHQKDHSAEIEIHGKTDSMQKDFIFHDVVAGDTLQSIHITGNADFIIRAKHHQSDSKSESSKQKDSLNIIAKYARKAVAQSTIKETGAKINHLKKEVKETGFTFGAWLWAIIAFIVIVGAIWALIYFGKFNIKKIIKGC